MKKRIERIGFKLTAVTLAFLVALSSFVYAASGKNIVLPTAALDGAQIDEANEITAPVEIVDPDFVPVRSEEEENNAAEEIIPEAEKEYYDAMSADPSAVSNGDAAKIPDAAVSSSDAEAAAKFFAESRINGVIITVSALRAYFPRARC